MKDPHTNTLRTFDDGCDFKLRYDGDTAHFEFWVPGEKDPEPVATIPAIGGVISWAPIARDLLEDYDAEKAEMIQVDYADDIRSIVENYAALPGDRRRYQFYKNWNVWDRRLY